MFVQEKNKEERKFYLMNMLKSISKVEDINYYLLNIQEMIKS